MYAVECNFNDMNNLIGYIRLDGICIDPFRVHVTDQSVFLNDKRISFRNSVDGCEYGLFTNFPYVFERLILIFNPHDEQFFPIHTLDDFRRSSCEMVMFVYDAAHVDIYVKDSRTALLLHKNAKDNHANYLFLSTNEHDMRQEFYV